jgi:hypothetical protein
MTNGGLQQAINFLNTASSEYHLYLPNSVDYEALVLAGKKLGFAFSNKDVAQAFRILLRIRNCCAV